MVRNQIPARAKDLGLPATGQQVNIEANTSGVTVGVDGTAPIDLKVSSLQPHLSPASENLAQ